MVSHGDDTISVLDPETLTPIQVYALAEDSRPVDIAVVDGRRAFVTRELATHLLRLDLTTGDTTDIIDLSVFADTDGIPDMNFMAMHEEKLFIQIRRRDDITGGFGDPPYLAVVDVNTEQLIDVDPVAPGVQAIELVGTAPKFKMQIVPETNRLFVSASGEFFDAGGIEMIDLDSLASLGLVIAEHGDQVGADLGAFVMVTPEVGYLTFSTDFALSSHLKRFTVSGGVETVGELYGVLGYFVPVMVFDPPTNTFFFPDGNFDNEGVQVFDAATGERLTEAAIAVPGPPTDLLLICDGKAGCAGPVIPAVSHWGVTSLVLLLLATGTMILRTRKMARL
jgi:hypothetical protein